MLPPQKHYTGHCWWVICDTKMVLPSSTCLQNDGSSRFGAKLTLTFDLIARSFKVNIKMATSFVYILYIYRTHL